MLTVVPAIKAYGSSSSLQEPLAPDLHRIQPSPDHTQILTTHTKPPTLPVHTNNTIRTLAQETTA